MRRRDPEGGQGAVPSGEPGIEDALGPEMTVVARDAQLEGTLVSDESIRVDGRATGTIAAAGDVILSSHSKVEGEIRSKVLVVRDGAVFSGRSTMDPEDAPEDADGSEYPEDELRTAYEEAVRRAAEWYRSRLFGTNGEPDHERGAEPDAISEPDAPMSEPDDRRPLRPLPLGGP